MNKIPKFEVKNSKFIKIPLKLNPQKSKFLKNHLKNSFSTLYNMHLHACLKQPLPFVRTICYSLSKSRTS